jgi:uncharacterized damage-inducible protein DinB
MDLEALKIQFRYTHGVIKMNTEGLTHEESCLLPSPAGNCMNWVVGHILTSRNGILKLLGREAIWSEERAERYRRGSAPIASAEEAVPFEQMLADLDASQPRLLEGLERFDLSRLNELTAVSPGSDKKETIGTLLALLTFHEAYHSGQTGLIRRTLGKNGVIQ